MNPEGMVGLLDYREDGITPFMLFFKDGLLMEKFVSTWRLSENVRSCSVARFLMLITMTLSCSNYLELHFAFQLAAASQKAPKQTEEHYFASCLNRNILVQFLIYSPHSPPRGWVNQTRLVVQYSF